jgi:hypothetical protein
MPVFDNNSVYDKQLNVSDLRVTYNIGADININFNNWRLETGLNFMNKPIVFYQRTFYGSGSTFVKDIVNNTSFEFPLLVGHKLLTRDRKTFYHIYGVAGASYEVSSFSSRESQSDGLSTSNTSFTTKQKVVVPLGAQQMVNAVVGFHINAIVHKLGMIDYGVSYHYPFNLEAPGKDNAYYVTSTFNTGRNTSSYSGTFYPHLSYINFKLAYYFINLDRNFRRKHYQRL